MQVRPYRYEVLRKLARGGRVGLSPSVEVPDEAVDRAAMAVLAVISTDDEDRSRDVVVSRGVDTSWHERNPIVLLEHGEKHQFPIARAESPEGDYGVRIHEHYLTGRAYFSQSCPVAEQVFRLVDEGVLRGASIGFRPLAVKKRHIYDDDGYQDDKARGLLVERCELLEFSLTAIPDNPRALVAATDILHKGYLCGRPLSDVVRKSLLPYARPVNRNLVQGGWQEPAAPTAPALPPVSPHGSDWRELVSLAMVFAASKAESDEERDSVVRALAGLGSTWAPSPDLFTGPQDSLFKSYTSFRKDWEDRGQYRSGPQRRWYNPDTGQSRYQISRPGTGRKLASERAAARPKFEAVHEEVRQHLASPETATEDSLHALADKIQAMTRDEARKLARMLGESVGGRKKELAWKLADRALSLSRSGELLQPGSTPGIYTDALGRRYRLDERGRRIPVGDPEDKVEETGSHERAEDEERADTGADQPGVPDGSGDEQQPGGDGLPVPAGPAEAEQRYGRIVTARAELVPPIDTSALPESLRGVLSPHQQEGTAAAMKSLQSVGGFLLADGTGAGKSRVQVAVGKLYADQGKKVLIISKAESIKPDWAKGKIAGSFDDDSKAMGIGLTLTRGDKPLVAGQIAISTYENLGKLKDFVDGNTVIVFDESHALKNHDSKRSEDGVEMALKAAAVLYATATPADKPMHLHYLFRLGVMGQGRGTGPTYLEKVNFFQSLGMQQVDQWTGTKTIKVWRVNPRVGEAEVQARMTDLADELTRRGLMLKREISMQGVDVGFQKIALPPECHDAMDRIARAIEGNKQDIENAISDAYEELGGIRQQQKLLREDLRHAQDGGAGFEPGSAEKIRASLSLLQSRADGLAADIEELKESRNKKTSGLDRARILMHQRRQQEPYKVAQAVQGALKDLQEGRQVVLFVSRVNESSVTVSSPTGEEEQIVSSKGTAELLRDALKAAGIEDVGEIHGGVSPKSRRQAMADFQAGKARVVIATIESGGTGINLDDTEGTRPRSMYILTPPFSAVENVQAAGRIWRLKTKSDARIRYLIGDTPVDAWNAGLIAGKMKSLKATVQGEIETLDVPTFDLSADGTQELIRNKPGQQVNRLDPDRKPFRLPDPRPKPQPQARPATVPTPAPSSPAASAPAAPAAPVVRTTAPITPPPVVSFSNSDIEQAMQRMGFFPSKYERGKYARRNQATGRYDSYTREQAEQKARAHLEKQAADRHVVSGMNLPKLVGSQKQLDWAETVRTEKAARIAAITDDRAHTILLAAAGTDPVARLQAAKEYVLGQAGAGWWLDVRDQTPEGLLRDVDFRLRQVAKKSYLAKSLSDASSDWPATIARAMLLIASHDASRGGDGPLSPRTRAVLDALRDMLDDPDPELFAGPHDPVFKSYAAFRKAAEQWVKEEGKRGGNRWRRGSTVRYFPHGVDPNRSGRTDRAGVKERASGRKEATAEKAQEHLQALFSGEGDPAAHLESVHAHLSGMYRDEVRKLAKVLGSTVSGTKAELAKKVAKAAVERAKAGGWRRAEKPREEPAPEPEKTDKESWEMSFDEFASTVTHRPGDPVRTVSFDQWLNDKGVNRGDLPSEYEETNFLGARMYGTGGFATRHSAGKVRALGRKVAYQQELRRQYEQEVAKQPFGPVPIRADSEEDNAYLRSMYRRVLRRALQEGRSVSADILQQAGLKQAGLKDLAAQSPAPVQAKKPEPAPARAKAPPTSSEDHPLEGLGREEALDELKKHRLSSSNSDPWGLASRKIPHEAETARSAVVETVRARLAKSSFDRPRVGQIVSMMQQEHGLSKLDAQSLLVQMAKAKQIRLDPFTGDLKALRDVNDVIPLDREVKAYIDLGPKANEVSPAGEPSRKSHPGAWRSRLRQRFLTA